MLRVVPCGPRAQHEPSRCPNDNLADSLTTSPIHQMNDMPQSEPADQEQMVSVQQARRLGPP